MLVLKLNELEKIEKIGALKKCIIFTTGAKPVQIKELNITTEALNIAPQKELLESVKTGLKTKKAVEKYVKSVFKHNYGGLSYINMIQIALQGNKIPVLLLDDTSENYKLESTAILATLKKFGVKPYTMKSLKKAKVLKGKKKAAKKNFIKAMNKFAIENDKKYSAYKEKFIFEILAIDIQNQYALKDGLNKEARRKYAKRLMKALNTGKKKDVKKNMKKLVKFLKIENLDMPKMKKLSEGKCSAEELVIAVGHMAALKFGEFASDEYFKEMGAIISNLSLEITIKEFKAAIKPEQKAAK